MAERSCTMFVNRITAYLEGDLEPPPVQDKRALQTCYGAEGYFLIGKLNQDYDFDYTRIAFDLVLDWGTKVGNWLRERGWDVPVMDPTMIGFPDHWYEYEDIMLAGRAHHRLTGEICEADLCPQLIGLEGKRVEVVDRLGEKRRFKVRRSRGWFPCHLEVPARRQFGIRAVTGTPFQSVTVVTRG